MADQLKNHPVQVHANHKLVPRAQCTFHKASVLLNFLLTLCDCMQLICMHWCVFVSLSRFEQNTATFGRDIAKDSFRLQKTAYFVLLHIC